MNYLKLSKPLLSFFLIFFSGGTLLSQNWLTDLNEAKHIAEEENKLIVLVFQGSDWCAPCIRMDKEIWTSDAFKKYSNENLILVKADFPRRKENKLSKEQESMNEALAEKYNEEGAFPLVVVLDKNERILKKGGYEKNSPEEYIAKLKQLE
ncbi:MAG: thioredoxin family protein [Flavobacteriales bacterium]|nr:thioredoxin family protein [Flavobacteriales bacterium]